MGANAEKQRDAGRGQSLFREVNERILEVRSGAIIEVLCECGTGECTETFEVATSDYEAIRRFPDRFLVVSAHVRPGVERPVDDYGSFVVVEKVGEAGEVAVALGSRSD